MKNQLNPPTEQELDWLDDFLLNRIDEDVDVGDRDEGINDLSTLDGFFTAIVSGPDVVPPSRWIPSLWGDFEPEWASDEEAETALTLLFRYMNSVAAFLLKDPKNFEPMFLENNVKGKTYTSVDDWCEGYMRGVHLLDAQWQQQSTDMKILLAPIKFFTLGEGPENFDDFSELEIENLQKAVTPNVRLIHKYWLEKMSDEEPHNNPFRHKQKLPGRNDPCPCGSGKKYKKCCLH